MNEGRPRPMCILGRASQIPVVLAEQGERLVPGTCYIGAPAVHLSLIPKEGYEVCRRLRSRPATSSAIIIALSGWGQEEHRRKAKESGFDDYLVKPVEYAALAASLERLRKR